MLIREKRPREAREQELDCDAPDWLLERAVVVQTGELTGSPGEHDMQGKLDGRRVGGG